MYIFYQSRRPADYGFFYCQCMVRRGLAKSMPRRGISIKYNTELLTIAVDRLG